MYDGMVRYDDDSQMGSAGGMGVWCGLVSCSLSGITMSGWASCGDGMIVAGCVGFMYASYVTGQVTGAMSYELRRPGARWVDVWVMSACG